MCAKPKSKSPVKASVKLANKNKQGGLRASKSPYIGETEKNLGRLVSAAEENKAVLLFDEADALFGKRSNVKDAHDRYANLESAVAGQKVLKVSAVKVVATKKRRKKKDE